MKTESNELEVLRSALKFIHEIAYEDLRTDDNGAGTWSIEAIAAKALGLSDEQRDLGFTADDKLKALIVHIGAKCDAEVTDWWHSKFKVHMFPTPPTDSE